MTIQEFSMYLKCQFNQYIFSAAYSALPTELSDQVLLPVRLIAQLVEHCTGIAKLRVWIPVQAPIFQAFLVAASAALKMRGLNSFKSFVISYLSSYMLSLIPLQGVWWGNGISIN